MQEWQPIETASKDAAWILGYAFDPETNTHLAEAMRWQTAEEYARLERETYGREHAADEFEDDGWWVSTLDWEADTFQPTHWLALPDPPVTAPSCNRTSRDAA